MKWLQINETPSSEMVEALKNSSRYEIYGSDVADEMEQLRTYNSTIHLIRSSEAYNFCLQIRLYFGLNTFISKKRCTLSYIFENVTVPSLVA